MPKLKTRKAAAGSRQPAPAIHPSSCVPQPPAGLPDPKQKRHLATKAVVHETDELRVVHMLPRLAPVLHV